MEELKETTPIAYISCIKCYKVQRKKNSTKGLCPSILKEVNKYCSKCLKERNDQLSSQKNIICQICLNSKTDVPTKDNDPKKELKEFPRFCKNEVNNLDMCHECSDKIIRIYEKNLFGKPELMLEYDLKFFKWIIDHEEKYINDIFKVTRNLCNHCYSCNFYCGEKKFKTGEGNYIYSLCEGPLCMKSSNIIPWNLRKPIGLCEFCIKLNEVPQNNIHILYQWCNLCMKSYLKDNQFLPILTNKTTKKPLIFEIPSRLHNCLKKKTEIRMILIPESISMTFDEIVKILDENYIYDNEYRKSIIKGYNEVISELYNRFSTFIVCCDIKRIMPIFYGERMFLKKMFFNYVFPYKKEISAPLNLNKNNNNNLPVKRSKIEE